MALTIFNDPFLTDVERTMQQAFQPFLGSDLFPASGRRGGPGSSAMALASGYHPMDVVEHADRYAIVADAPGMTPDNIRVELVNETLHVSGEKRTERQQSDDKGGVKMHRHERTFTKFSRTFALPEDARVDGITARIDNGVLTVDIPKLPKDTKRIQPVRIQVAGGGGAAPLPASNGAHSGEPAATNGQAA